MANYLEGKRVLKNFLIGIGVLAFAPWVGGLIPGSVANAVSLTSVLTLGNILAAGLVTMAVDYVAEEYVM